MVANPVLVKDRHIPVPTQPGLGIEVDERAAARYPFKTEALQRHFHPDGAVADW
ncbi:MAG: hypothetical protein HY331_02295 [Chloroflexi bacterium]|nr:hypothetical protein [Chloroflexota bacterium]